MSVGPLIGEIACVFLLSVYLLHKYGDWRKQHVLVTVTTFVSWYFSFIIIFMIPLDVTSTFYKQCIDEHTRIPLTTFQTTTVSTDALSHSVNTTAAAVVNATKSLPIRNATASRTIREAQNDVPCEKPWSYIPENILPDIWLIVYWTTFILTWIIMPLMKSYANAGDFTISGKLKSAIIQNAIWYGSYLLIFGVLLIYVAANPNLQLDGDNLQVIGITASNTWGLFLLVLLLGYGLVEVPRQFWAQSRKGYLLNYTYFQLAKLSTERSEATEELEDLLEDIRRASDSVRYNQPIRKHVNTIISKCPENFQESLSKHLDDFKDYSDNRPRIPTEKELVRLHQKLIFASLAKRRTDAQWDVLIEKALHLEDIQINENNHTRKFKHSFDPNYSFLPSYICSPTVEWYWYVWLMPTVLKVVAILLLLFSLVVVWSEVTFFSIEPELSLFAIVIDAAARDYNYLCIELLSCIIIAYLCWCAYYTVFKVRVFNYYYLAPHHQTDENSLLFCGTMLCRLTPSLCLNFLGLIHLDGHVTGKEDMIETSYTSIMGRHIDVLPFMEAGFYIYYPITVVLLCIATYFHLGSRCLSFLGFQQFVGDEDMTTDLMNEGLQLVKRERRNRQRQIDGELRRKNFREQFPSRENGSAPVSGSRFGPKPRGSDSDTSRHSTGSFSTKAKYSRREPEDSRVELLRDSEPIDYNEESAAEFTDSLPDYSSRRTSSGRSTSGYSSDTAIGRSMGLGKPRGAKGIFDDV
ncbi:G-protein coupled receptor-associated protein LMBRD2-like [Patiria miniata]|uniref:Uncharacterized protein n=1 Tax=Patiria miniata TaxID=46514 RepID=A0A913ZC33_PATMI|nr:G-protein coupled receptor-associated protein LMBRD2-like [Patiria miniata]